MRKFILISALAALVSFSTPVLAQDSQTRSNLETAGSAAAGAAAGAIVAKVVNVGGNSVNCDAIPVQNLSTEDFQHIKDACAALNKSTPAPTESVITPDKVREWGSIAKEFGSAIGATAKELGVQVNDFLRTPAGVLLTLYLFWSKLGGVLIGVPLLIAIWIAYYRLNDRFRRTPTAMEVRPTFFGMFNREVVTAYEYNKEKDTVFWAQAISGVAVIVGSVFIVGLIIL